MKIVLCCNAAMSTSIIKMKLREELKNRGIEGTVDAYPFTEGMEDTEGVDVFLLGPQIRYVAKEFTERVAPVPVHVIPMQDYNILHVGKILDDALALIK